MKNKEIDDVEFRRLAFAKIAEKDNPRRFEIHFTDLPYSLINAFYRKLFPQEYTEEDYGNIATWMRA